MNAKQRKLMREFYLRHLENGIRGDIASAYIDIRCFFDRIKTTDAKLSAEMEAARIERENN